MLVAVTWTSRPIDDGPRRLVLREGGGVYELVCGNLVLLSSAALETELAFGRLAARYLTESGATHAQRVLIGGLGFGATLRGVLDVVDPNARVAVVEKVAAVERLARGELAAIGGRPLDDPRVTVVIGDVSDVLSRQAGDLDVILLDVDNGPHWASFRSNARLYTPAGLGTALRALVPGGSLGVWSGYPADGFLARLRDAGFAPSRVAIRERGRVRARAYVGTKLHPGAGGTCSTPHPSATIVHDASRGPAGPDPAVSVARRRRP
jgi:hypothetical protein